MADTLFVCHSQDVAPHCPECNGVGWLLNDRHAGAGSSDPGQPLSLDLLPCIYPECDAIVDGRRNVRPIATLAIRGQFTDVVRHPKTGAITALTGFTEAVYR